MLDVINDVVQTQDNEKIAFRHYKSFHEAVIVIAPGFLTSKDAEYMNNLALTLHEYFDVISFDFRGHGESTGLFAWTSKELHDLDAIIKYAKESYKKIGVIGFSLGGSTAIIWGSEAHNKVDSMCIVSAPSDFWRIDSRFWQKGSFSDMLYNISPFTQGKGVRPGNVLLPKKRPIDCISKFKKDTPVLFIHGDQDWLVNHWHSESLYQQLPHANKRLEIIREGQHAERMIAQNPEAFYKIVKSWFNETLRGVEGGFRIPLQRFLPLRLFDYLKKVFYRLIVSVYLLTVLSLAITPTCFFLSNVIEQTSLLPFVFRIILFSSAFLVGYSLFLVAMICVFTFNRVVLRMKVPEGIFQKSMFVVSRRSINNCLWEVVKITFFDSFLFSTLIKMFYRVLGAKIGKGVYLSTKDITDPGLVEIGDGTEIRNGVSIRCSDIERDFLRFKKVIIGRHVIIDDYVSIMPGVIIGDSSYIISGSTVPKNTVIPSNSVWDKDHLQKQKI